jgi:L-seryl-tRNA(Ser) seleniumtransferase
LYHMLDLDKVVKANPANLDDLRALPSVDRLLKAAPAEALVAQYGRPLTLEAVRETLAEVRARFREGQLVPDAETILGEAGVLLEAWTAPTILPLINATGVIIHTNLGRAPLSQAARQAVETVAQGYSNLEYDVSKGRRGSRLVHAEALLQRLTGAEAALTVNNNAAAVMLVLTALARRRRVVIARTQLVEIGGGFRVPDVMRQSNARLVEVGTTNRVHLTDYEEALEDPVALIMRAHRSNFQIIGFTSEPDLEEIADLAHQHDVPVIDDLGSGALLDTAVYGLGHEPMVQESLAAGADLVCFSADKLVGGPQAGIIVGRADLVARLKKHPLARAVRADKLCLAALSATLTHYVKDEAVQEIPVWRMIAASENDLQARAIRWAATLGQGEIIAGHSTVGGGSLPEETLPTRLLALDVRSPNRFQTRLRKNHPPIIARVEADRILLDPRTVLPEQEETLLAGLQAAL